MGEKIQIDDTALIKILLVDHQHQALQSLKEKLSTRYFIMTAEDGIEAQMMLECKNDFDLVVSVQAMPVMKGIELFEWIDQEHPQTPKIMWADLNEFSDASKTLIDKNKYTFINKNDDHTELLKTIGLAVIGVKPVTKLVSVPKTETIAFKDEINEVAPDLSGCKMAVFDTNTKNWPAFDKLTKKTNQISEVVYFRNPVLLLERLKKDPEIGVVCIDFDSKDYELNNVIEQIHRIKHAANVILMCTIDQAIEAVEYQFKGVIYQRVIKPSPSSKLLFEIEDAAKQANVGSQNTKEKSDICPVNENHMISQSDSQISHAIQ